MYLVNKNNELLKDVLVNMTETCNQIYTKIDRQPKDDYETSEEDLLLLKSFNTFVTINQLILDKLYPERKQMNLPNPKHLGLTKHGQIVEIEVTA
tara:strand:+ start:411 stop:695 length:285 start_codon:yes stop_codon:yes gene_type:complete